MNATHNTNHHIADSDALEARFGLRVSAHLSAQALPPDVTERLRFAREQALTRRKRQMAPAPVVVATSAQGAAVLGSPAAGEPASRWWPAAWILPAAVLAVGLFLIQEWHSDRQLRLTAEIDSALLSDDLPPSAYADPGFAEFLRSPKE